VLDVLRQGDGGAAAGSRPPGLAQLDSLVAGAGATGLEVRTQVEGLPRPLPAGTDGRLPDRPESLTNVTRHAGPASATVLVRYGPDDLTVRVDDDGRGPVAATGPGNGNGIRGMRERVAALGGELTTGPRPGGGFRVQARLPIDESGDQ
jgi:signal transduction histidine kinase